MSALPLAIQREQAPLNDPDQATLQTVDKMQQLIASAENDPAIDWACDLALGPQGKQTLRTKQVCTKVWIWVKQHVRLVEDNDMVRRIFGADQDQLDLLIAPSALLRMTPACGDCATFTMLVSAMLNRLGIDNQIVAAAVNPLQPTVFSHAYCQVELPEGGRFVMDVSHGKFPGWEVPAERRFRKQAWNVPRSTIAQCDDARSPEVYTGLHGVTPAPTVRAGGIYGVNPVYTRNPGGQRFRRRRGMGDDGGIDTTPIDPNVNYGPATPPNLTVTSPVPSTPSQLPSVLNFFSNLFKSSVPLIQQATLPSGAYVQTTPYGTTISNTGVGPGVLSTGVSSLSGMMPILLLAIGGVVLISALKK